MMVEAIDISCLYFLFWIRGVHHRAPGSGRARRGRRGPSAHRHGRPGRHLRV